MEAALMGKPSEAVTPQSVPIACPREGQSFAADFKPQIAAFVVAWDSLRASKESVPQELGTTTVELR